MTYFVELTRQAETDLRDLFDYVAVVLQSPQSAENLLARLENKILSLEHMPERHHRYRAEPWYSRGLRVMVVDPYYVFYIPRPNQQIVSIIRVIYGARDIERLLAEDADDVFSKEGSTVSSP